MSQDRRLEEILNQVNIRCECCIGMSVNDAKQAIIELFKKIIDLEAPCICLGSQTDCKGCIKNEHTQKILRRIEEVGK